MEQAAFQPRRVLMTETANTEEPTRAVVVDDDSANPYYASQLLRSCALFTS